MYTPCLDVFLKFHPRSQPSDTTTKCSPSISPRCLNLSISFASYPSRFRTRSPCVPFSFPSLLYNRDIHFSFCFIAYYYYYHSSFSISRLLFLSGFEDLHYFIHLTQTMWTMLTGQNKWHPKERMNVDEEDFVVDKETTENDSLDERPTSAHISTLNEKRNKHSHTKHIDRPTEVEKKNKIK